MNKKNIKTEKYRQCSRCQKKCIESKICLVDDKALCLTCLYGSVKPFKIYSIGIVKNELKQAQKGFGIIGKQGLSCIELLDSQKPFLHKIEDETHITVVYYLHKADKVRSVFSRGLDGKKVGVFASRTPYRLSRIAIQDVRLIRVDGIKLYVEGLDAINGSPVLDIKMKWHSRT